MMRFANDFHSWLRQSWKLLANRLTRDPKIVIHGNSCIILYIQYTYQIIELWVPAPSPDFPGNYVYIYNALLMEQHTILVLFSCDCLGNVSLTEQHYFCFVLLLVLLLTNDFLAAIKQLYEWFSPSVCPYVRPSHLFDYVPIILSSQNFQESLPMTKVTSMQKVKVRGQRSRSQR